MFAAENQKMREPHARQYLLPLQPLLELEPHRLVGAHHPRPHHVGPRVSHPAHSAHPGEAAALAHLREHGPEAPLLGLALHGVPSVAGLHGHGGRSRVALPVQRLLVHHHGRVLAGESLHLRLGSLVLSGRDKGRTGLSKLFI